MVATGLITVSLPNERPQLAGTIGTALVELGICSIVL